MLTKTYSAEVTGMNVVTVTIETHMSKGVLLHVSGLADAAVKESFDRIKAAISNIGGKMPVADLTVNLSPADIKKEGSGYDLPMAIGILGASEKIRTDMLGQYMMVGELGLDGSLRPVRGVLPLAIKARADKFKGLIVPAVNGREAAVVNNLDVYGMESLVDVIKFFNGEKYEPIIVDTRKEFYENQSHYDLDYADVRGQENVKRALEIAAAGGHNMILL